MRKTLLGILIAIAFGSGSFLALPQQSEAASCPAGTTPVRRTAVFGLISTLVDDCYRDGVLVGMADPISYVPREPTGDVEINECAGITGGWGSGTCWGISFLVLIGTGITSVLSSIPWYADKLLNVVVDNTVLFTGFNALYSYASPGVEKGWELIRDLANIGIIAVFVFVAICIILGLKEYGQKKLIAKVLLVAILINFSFLFTRLIINFSNGLATSVYSRTLIGPDGKKTGIGVRFLDNLKIGTVDQVSSNVNQQTRNGLVGTYNAHGVGALFMHIFVAAIVSIVSGVALLYIAFLLMMRFVVLIALLAVSSAAFAAYLLPGTTTWWTMWWHQLWKNAFLAPILFIFLWIALNISDPIRGFLDKTGIKGKTFGDISPGAMDNPAAYLFMNYILVIGFLFAGIFVANSLSTALGRRFATNMTAAPFTLGAKALSIPPYLLFGGRGALKQKASLAKDADEARAKAAEHSMKYALNPGDTASQKAAASERARAASLTRQAEKAGARSNRSFNLADSSTLQKGLKAAGVSALFSGASSKGKSVADQVKVRAEAAAKASPKTPDTVTKQAAAAAEKNLAEQRKQSQKQLDVVKEQKKSNEAMLKQLHQQATISKDAKGTEMAQREAAANAKGDQQETHTKAADAAARAAKEAHEKIQKMYQDNPDLPKFDGLENGVTADLTRALQDAAREHDEAAAASKSHEDATPELLRLEREKVVEAIQKSDTAIAQQIASGNLLQKAKDLVTREKSLVDAAIAKKLKEEKGTNAQLAKLLSDSGAVTAATPAATPEVKH